MSHVASKLSEVWQFSSFRVRRNLKIKNSVSLHLSKFSQNFWISSLNIPFKKFSIAIRGQIWLLYWCLGGPLSPPPHERNRLLNVMGAKWGVLANTLITFIRSLDIKRPVIGQQARHGRIRQRLFCWLFSRQDKYWLDKCQLDSWNLFYMFPGSYL